MGAGFEILASESQEKVMFLYSCGTTLTGLDDA
jgi:hypothetical protein